MWDAIIANLIIVVVVVGAFNIRLEHRLTSIEVDIKWLKELITANCKQSKEKENELD